MSNMSVQCPLFISADQIFRIENDPKLTPTISFRTWISVCAAFKWFMVQFSIIYCPPDCLFSIWIAVLLSLLYCYVDMAGFHTARARYRITLSNLPKSVKMLPRKIRKYAYVASRHQAYQVYCTLFLPTVRMGKSCKGLVSTPQLSDLALRKHQSGV